MQITEFPARLRQHKRVLREIQGIWKKFSFHKCFRNTGFCPLRNLQNHPPFQFVCLSLVWVMTSLARFAIGRHVAKTVRRSPKLPALKASQISTNGAFRFQCKHCFLDAANQWLQMIRECGKQEKIAPPQGTQAASLVVCSKYKEMYGRILKSIYIEECLS